MLARAQGEDGGIVVVDRVADRGGTTSTEHVTDRLEPGERVGQRGGARLERAEQGKLVAQSPRLERRVDRLERAARRIVSAVLFAALFIGGVVLRADDVVFGTVLMWVSAAPLLHALFAGVIGRRGPIA